MIYDFYETIKQFFHNFNDPQYNADHPLFSVVCSLGAITFSIILFIIIFNQLIYGADFAKKNNYSMITFNMIIFAFPTWLIFGGIVLKAKNIPMFVYVLVFVVSLLIIIIRKTIGCKGQIGYIILYTLVQSFIGFVIGPFGIAAIGIGVFVCCVPLIILYAFTQKTFVQSLTMTGSKE